MITVGMNYEVLPGKEPQFEQTFDAVVGLMQSLPGHGTTTLYRSVRNPAVYLIVSEWHDRGAFEAFIRSDRFRKVTDWGREQVLAARPRHQIYGEPGGAAPGPAPDASRPGA